MMKRSVKLLFTFLIFSIVSTGCYTNRKQNELGGLMLLENTQISRNKAFYSRHNKKATKNVNNRYKKQTRKNYNLKHRNYR